MFAIFDRIFLFLHFFFGCDAYVTSCGCSNFENTNINLYNNYANAPYATYTAPQYTTANPNRCPANANVRPTSSDGGNSGIDCHADHQDAKTTNRPSVSVRTCGHHVLRKSKFDNSNNTDTVVTNKRQLNESVIEEGHNNNFVSTLLFAFVIITSLICIHWCVETSWPVSILSVFIQTRSV